MPVFERVLWFTLYVCWCCTYVAIVCSGWLAAAAVLLWLLPHAILTDRLVDRLRGTAALYRVAVSYRIHVASLWAALALAWCCWPTSLASPAMSENVFVLAAVAADGIVKTCSVVLAMSASIVQTVCCRFWCVYYLLIAFAGATATYRGRG